MHGPAKNRLHSYEAGWLPLLIQIGVATEEQAREAQARVAQAAINDLEARRERRRRRSGRRRRPNAEGD
jgi:hypothetical protein